VLHGKYLVLFRMTTFLTSTSWACRLQIHRSLQIIDRKWPEQYIFLEYIICIRSNIPNQPWFCHNKKKITTKPNNTHILIHFLIVYLSCDWLDLTLTYLIVYVQLWWHCLNAGLQDPQSACSYTMWICSMCMTHPFQHKIFSNNELKF